MRLFLYISILIILQSFNDINFSHEINLRNLNDSISEDSLASYDSLLTDAVNSIIKNKSVDDTTLKKIIPKTENEFLIFYSLTDPENQDEVSDAFYVIDRLFFRKACSDDLDFFTLYIKMAEFMDGEYAESYFEYVKIAISKHQKEFINLYPHLNKECKRRLKQFR